jgi:integrating conjugative element protein (TIGR03765 family)
MKSLLTLVILLMPWVAHAELVIVDDLGSTSALPYYRALNLIPDEATSPLQTLPPVPIRPYSEADMLPVKSVRLSPGKVEARVLHAPGLQPLFLIGDDDMSRAWLRARGDDLRKLQAVGLVVNVDQHQTLQELRQLAHDLQLAPTSGDQLAEMLGLAHYPVLITATGLEQ